MTLPQIDLIPLRAAVCSDQSTTLDVIVRITPPEAPPQSGDRPTLNLGFVVDRSGSMASRNKIEFARKAVCFAIEQLLPSDRFSVTIFDDQVQTLIPSTPANNKASATRLVQQIQPGSTTALHDGWVQAGVQVSQALTADLNRIILLSDGLANVGLTNPDAIASDVHGLAQRGVSTSTMGLGDDYNEDLLEAMARSGDGNYYYIDSAEKLTSIFEEELQGLSATLGKAVTLELLPQGHVAVSKVLNNLDVTAAGHFKLPNLLFGSPTEVVVRLSVPALVQDSAQAIDLCHFHLQWVDTEQQTQTLDATLRLPSVPSHQLDDFPINPDVQQQVALMMVAQAKREAVSLVDRGQTDQASQLLQQTKQQLLDFALPMSAPEAAALDDLDQNLTRRDLAKYRKMAAHQSYMRGSRRSRGHSNLIYAFDRGPRLGDISQQDTQAIVNSTDRHLSNRGAIAKAIHQAAGPQLLEACRQLQECAIGQATITPGFQLPAQWVIHTVCPAWQGGHHNEEALLSTCYLSCLELAASHRIHSIAFPSIGAGALGFPVDRAARIAFETISQFLQNHTTIGIVRLICFDQKTLSHYETAFQRFAGR